MPGSSHAKGTILRNFTWKSCAFCLLLGTFERSRGWKCIKNPFKCKDTSGNREEQNSPSVSSIIYCCVAHSAAQLLWSMIKTQGFKEGRSPRYTPSIPLRPSHTGSATWSQSRDQGCCLEGFIFPFHTLTQSRKKDLCRFRKFDSEALLNLLHPYCFGLKHSESHSPWGSSVRQCRSVGEDGSMVFGEIPISTIRRWGYNPFLLSLYWGGTR